MQPTVPEQGPWDSIADELERVADAIRARLIGEPAPGSFQLNIQPRNADGPGKATVKGRPETVRAVDAVSSALLGKDAETYPVSGGFHHGIHGNRGRVGVAIYTSVADPDAVDPDQEIARLRAENERLRAALPADPTGLAYTRADDEPDDPTPVSPARVPMHTGAMTDGGLVDETGDYSVEFHVEDIGRVANPRLARFLAEKEEKRRVARHFLGLEESAKHGGKPGDDGLVDETEEVTGAAITESCVITGWGSLCTTHQARHIASGEAECGCPVYPFAGRGDAADTIVDHRRDCSGHPYASES